MKKILVGYDGSSSADRAVAWAASLANATSAGLLILTILEQSAELQEFSRAEGATVGDVLESLAQRRLADARRIAEKSGTKLAATEMRLGDPTQAILDCACASKVDVVVLGKRGRGRLEGLLVGSVSQKVVSLCACPVVVVP